MGYSSSPNTLVLHYCVCLGHSERVLSISYFALVTNNQPLQPPFSQPFTSYNISIPRENDPSLILGILIGCKLCDTFLVDEPRCQSHSWFGFLYNDTLFLKSRNSEPVARTAAGRSSIFLRHLCTYSSRTQGAAALPLRLTSASASKSHSRHLLCQLRRRCVLFLSHTASSSSGDITAPFSSLISSVSACFLSSLFFIPGRMSDKKQRGKEKVKARDQRKFAKSKLPTSMVEDERLDGAQGMDDILKRLSSKIPSKFPNQYSQKKFKEIEKKNLHFERRLEIPNNLLQFVADRIDRFKWGFLERELVQLNGTWEKEALKTFTLDRNLILDHLTKPGSSWVSAKIGSDPTGISVNDLTIEARLWQQILTNYAMPSTHDRKITSDMAILIWCVLEEKQVYFPRLIRQSFWKIHKFGNLAFPCLITQMALKLNVEWDVEDYKPIVPRSKEIIPHGLWIYDLVLQLFKRLDRIEHRDKRRYEYLKRLIDCPNPPPEEPDDA
ncbi:hypothetical protein PIB30_095725 [Stylosanthes scabra]|uniref:Putative plant transposon protein domain-containing protein n=1 Tax=Stylosanthes scabra TaxID=79078 RepID=A0ABU6VU84_9FABA|nr:hypothetical protein [Stylosanthes scabra]